MCRPVCAIYLVGIIVHRPGNLIVSPAKQGGVKNMKVFANRQRIKMVSHQPFPARCCSFNLLIGWFIGNNQIFLCPNNRPLVEKG